MASPSRKRKGKNCSSACLTKSHYTFGECMRAKNLNLKPNLSDTSSTKSWDSELDAYASARAQGIKPAGTTRDKVDEAVRISQETGKAYEAW